MSDGSDVLADLLAVASEAGADRLVETDRLLRKLAGDDLVNEAHQEWTDRLREGLGVASRNGTGPGPGAAATASADVFDLTRRLRASSPARGRRGRR